MDKKIKTLVELYNFSVSFRVAFSRLCKSHKSMLSDINNINSYYGRLLLIDNDLEVYRCFGILEVFLDLGYISYIEFDYFYDVIARFQSFHFTE